MEKVIEALLVTRRTDKGQLNVVLKHIFSARIASELDELLPPVIEALDKISRELFEAGLEEVELEDHIVFYKKFSEYFIILITDKLETEQTAASVINKVVAIIRKYEPEQLENEAVKLSIKRELMKALLVEKVYIDIIRELAEQCLTMSEFLGAEVLRLEVEDIKPKKFKPKKSLIRRIFERKAKPEVIVEKFLSGDLEEAMKEASDLIASGEANDVVKVIYVKAGKLLIGRPIKFPMPDPNEVFSVAQSISDELLRNLVVSDVLSLWEVRAYKRLYELYIKNREEVFKALREGKEKALAYMITLADIPDARLQTIILNKLGSKYTLVKGRALTKLLIMQFSLKEAESLREWMRIYGIASSRYLELKGKPGSEFLLIPLSFFMLKVLEAKDVGPEDAISIVEEHLKTRSKEVLQASEGDNLLTTCHRALIKILGYYFPHMFLAVLQDKKDEILQLLDVVKDNLEVAVTNGKQGRYYTAMLYNLAMAVLLDMIARLGSILGKVPADVPRLALQIIDEDMRGLWTVNRFHYLFYLVALLSALGHTVLGIRNERLKKEMLAVICELLLDIEEYCRGIYILHTWLLSALLKLAKEGGLQEIYREVSEIVETIPPALQAFVRRYAEGL